jgi:hypothetical protein
MNSRGGGGDDESDKRLRTNTMALARAEQKQDSRLVKLAPLLVQRIASTFVAFEFQRYSATEDYLNLALTCKFLSGTLTGESLSEKEKKALATSRRVSGVLMPLDTRVIYDEYHNLSWRVCFETDLCVLVFFRSGIVRDGVRFVAAQAATMLEELAKTREDVVSGWISRYLHDRSNERFFGRMKDDRPVKKLIEDLNSGTFRIEELMYLFQCMAVSTTVSKALELPAPAMFVKDNPDWGGEKTEQFRKIRTKDKPMSHYLGISTDRRYTFGALEPHSSALGRCERVPAERKYGFGETQDRLELPFVAGPSGSTQAILSVAAKAGLLKQPPKHQEQQHLELQRQFLLATVAFLVGGGNHSFAEIMHGIQPIVKQLGYSPGSYVSLLPRSLTTTREWVSMCNKYRGYMKDELRDFPEE